MSKTLAQELKERIGWDYPTRTTNPGTKEACRAITKDVCDRAGVPYSLEEPAIEGLGRLIGSDNFADIATFYASGYV